jgi:hypothetical protein
MYVRFEARDSSLVVRNATGELGALSGSVRLGRLS